MTPLNCCLWVLPSLHLFPCDYSESPGQGPGEQLWNTPGSRVETRERTSSGKEHNRTVTVSSLDLLDAPLRPQYNDALLTGTPRDSHLAWAWQFQMALVCAQCPLVCVHRYRQREVLATATCRAFPRIAHSAVSPVTPVNSVEQTSRPRPDYHSLVVVRCARASV